VGAGQALITMGALPRRNRTAQAIAVLILQMPLRIFLPLIDRSAARPMRLLPADTPGLLTLKGYLQSIVDAPVDADAPMMRLMSNQLQALCLLLMRSAWPGSAVRGPAAWSHAARAVVAQGLGEPGLDERGVAARLGISGSYLRKLFAEEGGFAAYLRHERLQRAWLMLRDPLCTTMRVIDIGEACGFGDLSTFNRQFRRRFGATPTQVREAAIAPAPDAGRAARPAAPS
jgi:AraC-like DNA-binding protein